MGWVDCTRAVKASAMDAMMSQYGLGMSFWAGKKLPDLPTGVMAALYELEGGWIEVRIYTKSGLLRLKEPYEQFPSDALLLKVMLVAG